MPSHHEAGRRANDARPHEKKAPGKGRKEKQIAAAPTAATVAVAGSTIAYPTLDVAGDAVAGSPGRS